MAQGELYTARVYFEQSLITARYGELGRTQACLLERSPTCAGPLASFPLTRNMPLLRGSDRGKMAKHLLMEKESLIQPIRGLQLVCFLHQPRTGVLSS